MIKLSGNFSFRAFRQRFLRLPLWLVLVLCLSSSHAEMVPMIHRWEYDPDIGSKWIDDYWAQPRTANLTALRSHKLQTLVAAAQTASLITRVEVTNREEAFQALVEQLRVSPGNYQARLATVSAAVNLIASRPEVEAVWQAVASEPTVRAIVETKLIEWKSKLAIELWRERAALGEAGVGAFRYADLLTALEGLAVVGNEDDRAVLEKLLLQDGTSLPIQVAASKALGAVAPTGLESLAEQLLNSSKPQQYLLAANLLVEHTGDSAAALLDRVMLSPNYPAQIIAYRAIARVNAVKARLLAEELIDHPDNNLRMAAVKLLDQLDDADSLTIQAKGIADINPDIRNLVRVNLQRKAATAELRVLIDDVITFHLSSDEWEGTEQAIILAVALLELERIPRFLELLDHKEPEIFIRAAWALQMLELSTENLEEIRQRCLPVTQRLVDSIFVPFEEIVQTAFLFEAMGRHAYKPANDMLMLYVPKNNYKMIGLTRASAIYALGYIWQDSHNEQLADQLAERMLDVTPNNPEDELVRYNSALALGRIKVPDTSSDLDQIGVDPNYPISNAASWALRQLGQ